MLRIPDELAKELEAEARESHLTKSEIVRRRLVAASVSRQEPASGFEMIADLIGTVDGGPADMSTHKKAYLKTSGYGKVRRR